MRGRRVLAALAGSVLLGAAPAAHPALWTVRDADTVIYLFGTVHALPHGYHWRSSRLNAAVAGSDRLVVETVLGDPTQMAQLLIRLGTPAAPLPPLVERLAPLHHAPLRAAVTRSGVPMATLDRLETWAAAFLLIQPMMADLGVTPAQGVEESLKAEFLAAGRPVEGLETVAEQLGFIDGLSEADQRLFLRGFVEQAGDVRRQFAAMLAAWARGDEAAIARTFDRELKGSPALRQALLTRRNANWAAAVKRRLDETPGTLFVAVGAGHLAGADSVQALLRARGVAVTRVE